MVLPDKDANVAETGSETFRREPTSLVMGKGKIFASTLVSHREVADLFSIVVWISGLY